MEGTERPGWKRRAWSAGLVAISLFLAWKYVDLHAFLASLRSISLGGLAVLVAIVTTDRFVTAFKWRYIGTSLGIDLPYRACVRAFYASSLLNYVMPTSVAGDVYRGLRLSAEGPPKSAVFTSIMMEKLVMTAASLFWAWWGFFYVASQLSADMRRWVFLNFALFTVAGAASLAVTMSPRLHAPAMAVIRKLRWKSLVNAVEKAFEALRGWSGRKGRLMGAIGLGVVENGWDYAVYFLAGLFLNVDAPWTTFLAVIVMVHVVRKVALYAHSWSVAEVITVAAYGIVGIPPHQALAISLVRSAVIVIANLPGAVPLMKDGVFRKG